MIAERRRIAGAGFIEVCKHSTQPCKSFEKHDKYIVQVVLRFVIRKS